MSVIALDADTGERRWHYEFGCQTERPHVEEH